MAGILLTLAAMLRSLARLLDGFAVEFDVEVDVRRGGEVKCDTYEGACDVACGGLNREWQTDGMGLAC